MNKLSTLVLLLVTLLAQTLAGAADPIVLTSPNGDIVVNVEVTDVIEFSIDFDRQHLLERGVIAMDLLDEVLGEDPQLVKSETSTTKEVVPVLVPLKSSVLDEHYNALLLTFEKDFQVEFRAFDDGVSYRFVTSLEDSVTVVDEQADYLFADNYKAFLSETETTFSNYEHVFKPVWMQDFEEEDLAVLPLFVDANRAKVLLAEADLYDYPAMFLNGGNGNTLSGWFPPYPTKTEVGVGRSWSDRRLQIPETGDYIARTEGRRTYPWRIFTIANEDADIANSNLVYLLSRASTYDNFDWIKPGQTAWEWWHASNIIGVDFESGYNTDTYKYYIDFASEYGVEYILMDEGWSFSVTDISKPNPEIDLEELVRYAEEKGVDIILWASWLSVENTPTFFDQVKAIGAAGVKIDFMDRSDQWMMNYYERTARSALEHQLLVDFHGSISPRGLRRAYPNVISYEGLTGMEQNKAGGFDTPNNRVILPFTRNVVGPMDYTPGAMKSVHPENWHANWENPMSIGTRAHQLALFVVFESGLQMLADNPSDYYKSDECTRFITDVPTTWDETVVLAGEIGEFIVVAKRKGADWYVGGITNEEGRSVDVDLSFLPKDTTYTMTLFKDGVNATRYALDYKRSVTDVDSDSEVTVQMVLNGGFAAKLQPK